MDWKHGVSWVVGALMAIGGMLAKYDFKTDVCGSQSQPSQSAPAGK